MFSLPWSTEAKQKKAVVFVGERMASTFTALRGPGGPETLERAAANPYLSGFIQGKLTVLTVHLVLDGKLPKESANLVSGLVMLAAMGKDAATRLSVGIKAHAAAGAPDFKRGHAQGQKLAQYTLGMKDISQEPDLPRAVAKAKEAEALDAQIFPEAGASQNEFMSMLLGLELLWFLDVLYANE